MHRLSAAQARRIAVNAQLLGAPRPPDLLTTLRRLGNVIVDTTAHVAPSAELVCWSRLGRRFSRADLEDALVNREVVEFRGLLRPAEDIALFRAEMAAWPGDDVSGWRGNVARWVEANDRVREEILQVLRSEGPLPARDLPDEFALDWRSSGWNNNKNTQMLLERMEERGEVAVSHREGRERVWDLAERVYPDEPAVPLEESRRIRAERRLSSLGLARETGPECATEPHDVGRAGEEAVVEGARGRWRVDPGALEEPFRGRTAVLSPLDRLIFDRKRMADLFGFDYALEMYKPAAQRRWGYFALPVLRGADLIGKVDAESDHAAGVLRVRAVHADEPWSPTVRNAVDVELRSLARLLGLEVDAA